MIKKKYIIFIFSFLFGCIGLNTRIGYRIKKVEKNYNFSSPYYNCNLIYLTKALGDDERSKGRVYINIKIEEDNLIKIKSNRENYVIKEEKIYVEKEKYKKIIFLNDIIIKQENNKKMIIQKNDIRSVFNKKLGIDSKEILINLPEKLSGSIILELGRVKIGDDIYDIPKIYMQKYQETGSYSIIGGMLEEGGLNLPGYHSEGWIDD